MKLRQRVGGWVLAVLLGSSPVLAFLGTAVVVTGLGCASNQTAPGSEAFVVEAEKDLRTAFHVVDGFLRWELANRGGAASPDVTKIADTLRVEFPGKLASAEKVLRAYKANRDPNGKADLMAWVNTLTTAMLEAVKHLPTKEAEAAYAKAASK